MNIYFYPPRPAKEKNKAVNPYKDSFIDSISKYSNVVNARSTANVDILDPFRYLFKIDGIIFNWIEGIGYRRGGFLQFFLFLVILLICKVRNVKIVWILHNIHPHQGEAKISGYIKRLLFKNASLIIAHSQEAFSFAKSKTTKVVFAHHPNNRLEVINTEFDEISQGIFDILIWGTVEPYKGILEFVEYLYHRQYLGWRLKIIGKCKDQQYETKLKAMLTENISFENRIVSFSELKYLIEESKYVIFPYKSSSVSSSGALMDTLTLGGNVIGPHKGAFIDIQKEGLCFTFEVYDDIVSVLNDKKYIDKTRIKKFVEDNSWENFGSRVITLMSQENF